MRFKALLSPIRIGSMEVKNRFVVPPMGTCFADSKSFISQQSIDYYAARAKGGFGLIIVEVTATAPEGEAIRTQPGLWSDEFIPQFKKLVDECHKYGAKVAIQLHHAGRQTNSLITDYPPVAPSALPCPVTGEMPRELTTEEVYVHIQNFVDAAIRARKAGADAVEIHGAHGYLIAQFMSPYSNKRTDEFGGSFINRMRFPTMVIQGIREQVDANYPIIIRYSGDELITGGRTIEESCTMARYFEGIGVDAVHISAGAYGSMEWIIAPTEVKPGYLAGLAEEVKKSVEIPVITVGRYTDPFMAEDVLLAGKGDLVSFGRTSITDPNLPNKVAAGNLEEIAQCVACHQGCATYIFAATPMTCLVNPFVGKEGTRKIEPATDEKRVIVVGGGPGGLMVAWVMAKRGHQVSLYEKHHALGGQYRIGAIAPGKGEITSLITYYRQMCKKYGVDIHLSTEVTKELIEEKKPDVVVLATGATPLVPEISGLDHLKYVHATDVLEGKEQVGQNVLVVGGGIVGVETADFLSSYGKKVCLIEMEDEIMSTLPPIHKVGINERFRKHGVEVMTGTKLCEITADGVAKVKKSADGEEVKFEGVDNIVLALGATPYNPLEEELAGLVSEVYVIGDAKEARDALLATEEASALAVIV